MSKKILFVSWVLFFVVAAPLIHAAAQGEGPSSPVPESARRTFDLANKLAERERFAEALAAYKRASAAAPQFLEAHVKYIYVKAYFAGRPAEVRAEYESLMTKEPSNPIYPAALGLGLFAEPPQARRGWFEKVVRLAPDWVWSHYARAHLLQEKEPEAAVAELLKMIEKEPGASQAYAEAISLQRLRLKKTDDAIATAEKMLARPELRASGLVHLWRLRLAKAGTTEEAKAKLRQEISGLEESSGDVATLAAVRSAYNDLLVDKEAAKRVEEKIARVDAAWYPERGSARVVTEFDDAGPRSVVISGRQLSIYNKLRAIDYDLPAAEQTARLEQLLALGPDAVMKQKLYTRFFRAAERAGDNASMVKFGETLLSFTPNDASALALMALALADEKRHLGRALAYAERAQKLTEEFRPLKDLPGVAGNSFLEEFYSEKEQAQRYNAGRAQILEAHGWVLFRLGRYAEAETKLRRAIELHRTENRLSRLSKILRGLKRIEESERFALEAKNEYVVSLKRRFTNAPAKDFQLSTTDGRKMRLSDLKGKVVLVNFWATWCQPCLKEMPLFARIYERYKDRGFEILAISVDEPEDRPKVVSFVGRLKINFPILYDEGVARLYGATAYPTTIFIGKQGNVRYQNFGLVMETAERDLEIIIEELLNDF